MKKILPAFLAIIICLPLFFSCEKEKETFESFPDLTESFDTFYKAHQLVCWQDVAAVFSARKTLADYSYQQALTPPQTLEEAAGWVISVSLLTKQGNDMSGYQTTEYIDQIKTAAVDGYESLSVKELALCFYALTAANISFDYQAAAKHLESRQNTDGGFSLSSDYTYSDVESSAYALSIIMLSRRYISDDVHDSVLVYIANAINDDNTLSDFENKKSSVSTSLALNALIAATLPPDGEVSSALTTAINTYFKVSSGETLVGYKKHSLDINIDRETTGEVFLCFAATAYGNLWTRLFEENNA